MTNYARPFLSSNDSKNIKKSPVDPSEVPPLDGLILDENTKESAITSVSIIRCTIFNFVLLFFAQTPITYNVAILGHPIMAIMAILTIWVVIATDMVAICVSAKKTKNVYHL